MDTLLPNPRAQRGLLYCTIAMALIYSVTWAVLMKLFPLPPASWSVEQVASFYRENGPRIRAGATICGWTGGFLLPLTAVITSQLFRMERGFPLLTLTQFAGGLMNSLFLVLPPMLWGVAAYRPERLADVTAVMHEFANLILVSTDQYFVFWMVPFAIIAIAYGRDKSAPIPSWLGYLTLWAVLLLEPGALGYIPRTGILAWNGLLVFWIPLSAFGVWMITTIFVLFRSIRDQERLAT